MNWTLLGNSIALSASTALLCGIIGFAAALCLVCLRPFPGMLLLACGIAILALPPFLVVNAWLDFSASLPLTFNLLSLSGSVLVLSLLFWPIVMAGVWSAWMRLDRGLLECEPAARGGALISQVLLPVARLDLSLSLLLVFVLAMGNFAVPSILQCKVYPVEIWLRYNTGLSGMAALQASWPMVFAPLLILLLFRWKMPSWPHERPHQDPALWRRQVGGGWFAFGSVCAGIAVLASLAVPLAQILFSADTWQALQRVTATGGGPLWNSVLYAVAAASICTLLGLILGALAGARHFTWLFWVLFFLPGSIVGLGLIAGTNTVLPAWAGNSGMLVIAGLALRHVALPWTLIGIGYRGVDRRIVEVAALDCSPGWQTWRHGYWPQIARHTLGGWYAVFLLCLWEVDSLVITAPPGGDTLSMRAFNLLHYGHTTEVDGICLLLLLIALGPLVGTGVFKMTGQLFRRMKLQAGTAVACLCLGAVSCTPGNGSSPPEFTSKTFKAVEVLGARGAGAGQFTKPRSLTLDSEDNLFVTDMTGRVQKFSNSGAWKLSWQMPETDLGKAKGMCRDNDGNVVVIEPHYSRLNHFRPDGSLVLRWGEHGTNSGNLAFPRDADVAANGSIYVSEYGALERVQKFQLSGTNTPVFVGTFGKLGTAPGEFNRPEGLCVAPDGLVHVADSCNHRVQVFTPEGKFVSSYGAPGSGKGELSYPYDVCVDSSGLRFVCEFGNSRIQVFDAEGRSLEIIGQAGNRPGEFNNPWSIALDSTGNLYVADSQNHRVQKLVRRK